MPYEEKSSPGDYPMSEICYITNSIIHNNEVAVRISYGERG